MKNLLLLCLLAGCGVVDEAGKPTDDRAGWAYHTVHVDGMPCLIFHRVLWSGVWRYEGVSCDWSSKKNVH